MKYPCFIKSFEHHGRYRKRYDTLAGNVSWMHYHEIDYLYEELYRHCGFF